jgi:monoamine oxidase
MARGDLHGVRAIVAGAGLAGLSAARELEARGATTTVIEARDRVGGRVWTLREGFAGRQHAEAGADLIEGEQGHVRRLASELGLKPVRILRDGFGFYGPDVRGKRRLHQRPGGFQAAATLLADEIHDFTLAEERWDSAIARRLASMSVASWMETHQVPAHVRASIRAFRGFFLADPEELSVLPLVEQFAEGGTPADGHIYRIAEGNDRLATVMARRLRGTLRLRTIVRRVRQREAGVTVTVEDGSGRRSEIAGDFLVCALPASTARDVLFEPKLPASQHDAIASLRYGAATRLLLQFDRRFWKKRGRPLAFGSDLPTGAVWDGNEQQHGAGILSFLAGGRASSELQHVLNADGAAGAIAMVDWLGRPSRLLASSAVVWDVDPWVRGGYAFFDPAFDPLWRAWLSRPCGRIVFAGEHTSTKWQGYMNGAIESGLRAAAEIAAISESAKTNARIHQGH